MEWSYTLTRLGGVLHVYPGVDWLRLKAGAGYSEYSIEPPEGTFAANEDLGFLLGIEGSYAVTAKLRLEPFIEWARHDFSVRDQKAQMLQVGVAVRFVILSSK